MEKTFLYRLLKHSKIGFACAMLFLFYHAILFFKKMDTVFTPYNSMFAIDFSRNYSATTYLVRVNGLPVKITQQPYWKKDFLEESLSNYGKYKINHDSLFMDNYLGSAVSNNERRIFFSKSLLPGKVAVDQWLPWYVRFAGYNIPAGATLELWQYDLIFENDAAIIKDSSSVYKTSFVNVQ